jgi:hypothetical protein
MELPAAFTKSEWSHWTVSVTSISIQRHFFFPDIFIVISIQCVAIDAVVEDELVSALQVSVFPEIIFTKAGKILYREKGNF